MRLSTGFPGRDWVYGASQQVNGLWAWGLPMGAISLWAGAAGSGKSRLAIAVAAKMSRAEQRILYVQNEVSQQQFRIWAAGQQPDIISMLIVRRT